jgi:hypothetical protein
MDPQGNIGIFYLGRRRTSLQISPGFVTRAAKRKYPLGLS